MRLLWTVLAVMIAATIVMTAQMEPNTHLKVSNDDPRWGDPVVVSYIPADSCVCAAKNFRDTVYCAVVFHGAWSGVDNLILAMKRKADGAYEAAFQVPDSVYMIRIEICKPTDRYPDGITEFTVHMPNDANIPGVGIEISANIDSALAVERKTYPLRYEAYVSAYIQHLERAQQDGKEVSAEERATIAKNYIAELSNAKEKTISWYLTMARLHAQVPSMKKKATEYYEQAAQQTASDEILWNSSFWGMFFAPSMVDGQIRLPLERGRALAPLAERFAPSQLTRMWLQRMSYDTMLDVKQYNRIADAYKQSTDVDLLNAIAGGHLQEKSSLYDPQLALEWSDRAIHAYRTASGFYSGENIYGSMGRGGSVMATRMSAFNGLKRPDEAIEIGRVAVASVKETWEKEQLRIMLIRSYCIKKSYEDAERVLGQLLASTSRRKVPELDSVYQFRKQGSESKEEYQKRIVTEFGKLSEVPELKDFSYTTLDGRKGNTADFRGKIVVFDFWFIGCPGCVVERKSMDEFAEKFKNDTNVVLLGVALDAPSALKSYLKSDNPVFPVVPAAKAICDNVGVQGFPTHVIVDRNGKTVVWEMGGASDTGENLAQRVKELEAKH